MYNYNSLGKRSIRHHTEAHIRKKEKFIPDPSCVICYPSEGTTERFNKFWNWYKSRFPALTYTEYTTRIFQDLLNQDIREKEQTQTKLLSLVGSIRYSTEPEQTMSEIATKIIEIIICSKGFELNNEQTEKTKETTELINTEDIEITSETESEISEYNLNLLFEENLVNMAGITHDQMTDLMQGVFGAHGENIRPIMRVKEFSGKDDEDPHEWCAEFEKACAANGWTGNDNNVRRKDIAASYLRENAAEWYEADQGNIAQWHIDAQNDN